MHTCLCHCHQHCARTASHVARGFRATLSVFFLLPPRPLAIETPTVLRWIGATAADTSADTEPSLAAAAGAACNASRSCSWAGALAPASKSAGTFPARHFTWAAEVCRRGATARSKTSMDAFEMLLPLAAALLSQCSGVSPEVLVRAWAACSSNAASLTNACTMLCTAAASSEEHDQCNGTLPILSA